MIKKKIDIDLSNLANLFCNMWKKGFLEIKIQICFLLHKTKSFDLKNIKYVFKNIKKKWFFIYKRSICFEELK